MSDWPLGHEREVSPGNYACPVEQVRGWNIWTFDTANGKYLGINKPSLGGRVPVPLGIQQAFFCIDPYVSIIYRSPKPWAWFHGKYGFATAEFREVGARFMSKWTQDFDPLAVDGKTIEAVINSMPTERSFKKLVRQTTAFNFFGAKEVLEAADRIEGIKR